MLAIDLLRQMEATSPMVDYLRWQVERREEEELLDAALESLSDYENHTFSCGEISGGSVFTSVPASCSFKVNCRIRSGEEIEWLRDTLAETAAQVGNHHIRSLLAKQRDGGLHFGKRVVERAIHRTEALLQRRRIANPIEQFRARSRQASTSGVS